MSENYQTIDERQRYVQRSGRDWEDFVLTEVNRALKALGSELKAIRGADISRNSALWRKLAIPVGKPSSTQKIWGDVDLVVIDNKQKPTAVISCKTSLHGRFPETLFYAVVLKDLNEDLKVVFTTSDKGRQQKRGVWQSEWGSEEKPTKDRLLGSHYLDGIYVANERTRLGGMIKSLSQLPQDLIAWVRK